MIKLAVCVIVDNEKHIRKQLKKVVRSHKKEYLFSYSEKHAKIQTEK